MKNEIQLQEDVLKVLSSNLSPIVQEQLLEHDNLYSFNLRKEFKAIASTIVLVHGLYTSVADFKTFFVDKVVPMIEQLGVILDDNQVEELSHSTYIALYATKHDE